VRAIEEGTVNLHHTPVALQFLTEFDAEVVAYVTSRTCLTAAANMGKVTRTAIQLANLIAEHYQFDEAEQAEPALVRSMQAKAKRWPRATQRRRIMRTAARVAGIKRIGWTEEEKAKLGVKLVELFIEHTGFAVIEEQMDTGRGKSVERAKIIKLTPEVEERLKLRIEQLGNEYPLHQPMIVPPTPWTTPSTGGYRSKEMQRHLIRRASVQVLDEAASSDMPEVYSAVNHVQGTAWQINDVIYQVLEESKRSGSTLGGLPEQDETPIPAVPQFMQEQPGLKEANMTEDEKAEFTQWKISAREAHEYNGKLNSRRLSLNTKLGMAKDCRQYDAIYFPHSLDFRGRMYPLCAELSPQSDDIGKALLQFAEAKPLGISGGFWLCVHLANLFGVDKVSFDDRVLWVQMHHKQLMDSAVHPLDGHRFWAEADEPWCALAACMEYAAWQAQGDDYQSRLPIAMDGSCSGIQHFSALLRDSEGGAAVNLTQTDVPADIYTEVLHVVKAKLNEDKDPLSKVWYDHVDRKIVKRPCMTFAYSVTSTGIRNQIDEEMRKRQDGEFLAGTPNWKAAQHLAPFVEEAIREVVNRAAEAMDWLKQCATFTSKAGLRVRWKTPLGFPVLQPYVKTTRKVLKVYIAGLKVRAMLSHTDKAVEKDGKRLRLSIQEPTDIPATLKQASSVAPNFVHSLDASHLMMVVNRMVDEGITVNFSMIHDSFGVHACDVDEMHYAIRDEFIKLYTSGDIMRDTFAQLAMYLPDDEGQRGALPYPPEAGDLNLEEVRDADFFFA
jgi:DNA-directed RNA polymerase